MNAYADTGALKEKAEKIIAMARDRGAETAFANISMQREFEVELRHGDIENLAQAQSFGVSLSVSRDQRRANASSSDLSEQGLEQLADKATALCRYTDRDPAYTLPEKELLAWTHKDLDLYDPELLDLTAKQATQMCRELERQILAQDQRLQSDGASLNSIVATDVIANSLGFCGVDISSGVNIGVAAFAEDQVAQDDLNKGRKQSGGWTSFGHYLSDLADPDKIATLAANQVLRKLGARKPRTGRFPVYFEPKIARTLWSSLLSAISGGNIFRKESFLLDRLNSSVCAPAVTIVDDPTIIRGLGSQNYDAEGVASQPLTLIEAGKLNHYLMGTYSANKLKMRTTGRAGGSTNVVIQPGEYTEAELLKKVGTGVLVGSVFGQGVNISTGDYSRGCTGLWIEDGEIAYPISEFTLNSNLDRMFKGIVAIGNNVDRPRSIQTPGFVIDEMAVGGS